MFRGVSSSAYQLVPKVGRPELLPYGYDRAREIAIFQNFRRRAILKVPSQIQSTLDWLAVAQHHGLPTRLLDWTPHALVAAYFAVCSPATGADKVRIYALRLTDAHLLLPGTDPFDPTLPDVKFVIPPFVTDRVAVQRGCFSVHPEPIVPYQPKHLRIHDVSVSACGEIRRRLFQFGVDASTIMADLDGLAKALEWQYGTGVGVGDVSF